MTENVLIQSQQLNWCVTRWDRILGLKIQSLGQIRVRVQIRIRIRHIFVMVKVWLMILGIQGSQTKNKCVCVCVCRHRVGGVVQGEFTAPALQLCVFV